jgi:hypothetical protein
VTRKCQYPNGHDVTRIFIRPIRKLTTTPKAVDRLGTTPIAGGKLDTTEKKKNGKDSNLLSQREQSCNGLETDQRGLERLGVTTECHSALYNPGREMTFRPTNAGWRGNVIQADCNHGGGMPFRPTFMKVSRKILGGWSNDTPSMRKPRKRWH